MERRKQTTTLQRGSPATVVPSSVKVEKSLWDETATHAQAVVRAKAKLIAEHCLVHGQLVPLNIREVLEDIGEPVPLPSTDGLTETKDLLSVSWVTSATNAKRMTRLVKTTGGSYVNSPHKNLPDRSSKRIADIQLWQSFNEELKGLQASLKQAQRVVSLHKELTQKGWVTEGDEYVSSLIFKEAVREVTVTYYSTLTLTPQCCEYLARLYHSRGEQLLWYAPQDAFVEGKLQPPPAAVENRIFKLMVDKDKSYSSLRDSDREALAWRWLIISHNYTFPSALVSFKNKKLNFSY
jgi:hypothetical protein